MKESENPHPYLNAMIEVVQGILHHGGLISSVIGQPHPAEGEERGGEDEQ